jgi:hypothetical protein
MNKKISQLAVVALLSLAAVSANAACVGSTIISTSVNNQDFSGFCDVSITSTGTVGGSPFAIIFNESSNDTFNNAGVIGADYGVYAYNAAITTINNTGTISSSVAGILNSYGQITTINNTGTISSSYGVFNFGSLTTLNNLQGASGSALTIAGTLPTNYNIIINSSTDYGQLRVDGDGSMAFGIYDGSTIAADTIYNNVLIGVNGFSQGSSIMGSKTVTGATGVFNGLNYSLTQNSTTAGNWDLVVGSSIAAPVPEADTSAMLLTGLGVIGFMARRRNKVKVA